MVRNLVDKRKKIIFVSLFVAYLFVSLVVFAEDKKTEPTPEPQKQEEKEVVDTKPQVSLKISFKDGICRARSNMMMDVLFVNKSNTPEKVCVYKLYDSLLKLDIVDSFGNKLQFNPKLIKAKKLTKDDWILIPPKRTYKKSFSLNRKVYEETGQMIQPGSYTIKATYNSCSKFDPSLPDIEIDSNSLYFMVTE